MIPILLDGTTRIGWLKDCLSCEVTEERNGVYELTLTYPASGSMARELTVERFIKAKPNQTAENQLFKIYKVSKPISGIFTVNAEHVSYALSHYPISSVSLPSANPTQAINALLTNAANNLGSSHGFTVETSDIATNAAFSVSNVSARAGLGGVEGSVLDTYGGEFEFDNYKIKLHSARGSDNGVIISYGKNLTDVKCDISSDSSYTAVYAYAARDDISVSLTMPVTNSSGIAARVLMRDFSSEFGTDEELTSAALNEKVTAWLASNDINALTISMSVSFVDLSQSPEYSSYKLLERVNLCDTVTVRHKDLNLNITAKVIKTTYNVLNEKYSKVELGSARANFSSTIEQLQKETQSVKHEVYKTESKITQEYLAAIQDATAAITGNSGGYIRLNPAENPQELLIMNTPSAETATKIWRWNLSGLGYSSTGYSGSYKTAITQDGHIVADFIDTGILTANIIRAGIMQSTNGEFSFNLDTGKIIASDIDISGGSINLQGASEQTYYTQLTSSNASSLGWKSASEHAAEEEHKPYITADWLTPTSYPTTSPYYQAASQWYTCKKGDVFHLKGEGYNRAFGGGVQLDVVAWIQVMYKNDAGETAMSSMCATVIPFSSGETRVTTIDTTGTIYAPGYTPELFRICVATHKKGTQIDQAVTAGWYAFHNLEVSRTTTEGGSFTVTGSNGYIADLSSGVLRLSYKSGNDTQQFFDMANTRCYSSEDDYKWYATMATQDYTLSGKTSAGFKFGSSNEDTRSYIPTDPTDGNSSLQHEWNTTYARIEKDTTYIRRTLHVNEYGYTTSPGEYLAYQATGYNGVNKFVTSFGASVVASSPAFTVRVQDTTSAGNNYVRADLFAEKSDRAEVRLMDASGKVYRLTFTQSGIIFWSETTGAKKLAFV